MSLISSPFGGSGELPGREDAHRRRKRLTQLTAPPTLATIAMALQRFDGGAGPVQVSNGVPFAKGVIDPTDLTRIHVLVNGIEQPVYVRALEGRWSDGSVKSCLVQFVYDIPDAALIPAQIQVGGSPRTAADPAPAATSTVPAAAVLPTSDAYLCDAYGFAGRLFPLSAVPAGHSADMAYIESVYPTTEQLDWNITGDGRTAGANDGIYGRAASYDNRLTHLQYWYMSANPLYFYRGCRVGDGYLQGRVLRITGEVEWHENIDGMVMCYWATGDERFRYAVRKQAEDMGWRSNDTATSALYLTASGKQYGNDRLRARALEGALNARMLNIDVRPADFTSLAGTTNSSLTPYVTPTGNYSLESKITKVLNSQRTTGQFGGSQYSYGVWHQDGTLPSGGSNYMVGMLLDNLIRYYEEIDPTDTRIIPAVQACVEDWLNNQYVVMSVQTPTRAVHTLFYHDQRGSEADDTNLANPPSTQTYAPMGSFFFHAMAWLWLKTGNTRYRDACDDLIYSTANLDDDAVFYWRKGQGKYVDETYYRTFNSFAYRLGLQHVR